MRTNSDSHQEFRLARTMRVSCIFRGQFSGIAFGIRIRKLRLRFFQRFQHVRSALQNPYGLAAPLDRLHFTRSKTGNIHFNRRASGFRPLRRLECRHEDASGSQSGHAACRTGSDKQATPTGIDLLLITHTNPNQ